MEIHRLAGQKRKQRESGKWHKQENIYWQNKVKILKNREARLDHSLEKGGGGRERQRTSFGSSEVKAVNTYKEV